MLNQGEEVTPLRLFTFGAMDGPPRLNQGEWSLNPAVRVELASRRKLRERNKIRYRLAHWPIWIWVFFIAPGPLTFDLFAHGFDWRIGSWLSLVLLATGIAGLRGRLPGGESQPYRCRCTEHKPNAAYRRVC